MADSFNKKEREKKKRKRRKDKAEKKEQRKQEGSDTPEFMYLDENGHLTPTPPDPSKRRKIKAEDIDVSVPKQDKSDQPNFLRTGVVKFFNAEKGYGFIADQNSKEDFFVHADSLVDDITDNDKVTFEVASGPKGPVAINVSRVDG
ncbi:MAG: cold shock domain-containing protein [Phaeodactylibacter sp.]|nr:cold shock domain-containing protein [Phaeodactylibacter sp.]MCB9298572.1 cold shock domain-containing protein [Lewinellaceae bacterium]